MDIGQGQKMKDARELTAEIDRATDVVRGDAVTEEMQGMQGGVQRAQNGLNGAFSGPGMTSERAQTLGRGAIFGGAGEERVMYEGEGAASGTSEALDVAAAELSEDLNRVEHPEGFVGNESEIQYREYVEQDRENAENEMHPERSLEAKVAYRRQEDVARQVTPEVEKMMRHDFALRDLTRMYRNGVNEVAGLFERNVGGRN